MRLPWQKPAPRLSVVLVVYRMPDQAARTLQSLATTCQQGVSESDYEIIVVENHSDRLLGEATATSIGGNVRYLHRHETRRSPVFAVNAGAATARGSHIAVMIDGARMLTPGVLRLSLDAFRMHPHAAVAVPGYHLGQKLQQHAVNEGYDEQADAALLASIDWPRDGYRLHDIAVLSGSCRDGFLLPVGESNFLACSRERWQALGGMDERYDDYGGGYANLDLYKRLLERPDTPLFMLYGEGTFHQFHGGVTTGARAGELERIAQLIADQDERLHGKPRAAPGIPATLLGKPGPGVHRFLQHSLDMLGKR